MPRILFAALMTIALTATANAAPAPPVQVSGQTSLWRISRVLGVTVYNVQDEKVGEIVDLIMDPRARVTTAIVSVGSYLGVGDRLVEIPLEVLRFPNYPTTTGSAANVADQRWFPDRAVLGVTKSTLLSMPPFQY
jgi:sporulation protein YlmC with PRC-barrel domain